MRLALVASSYLPRRGGLERYVDQLARGLVRRGVEVEILTQVAGRRSAYPGDADGVPARRFPTAVGPLRFAFAPSLWEHMRAAASDFDIVHVHSTQASFALVAARAGFVRQVFTPHAPVERLLAWPHVRATQAVVASAAQIVCTSSSERDRLCRRFPHAARRTRVVPPGVDTAAIRAASSYEWAGTLLLTVGRLERGMPVDRTIAAMPGLPPEFSLVIVGDGPDRHRLEAYAADLRVSSRVKFAGAVSDDALYAWLRTANVLVALSEQHTSGLQVTEALAAGAAVVASDIPAHREAASRLRQERALLVSPLDSPLELADAISDAAALRVASPVLATDKRVPGWEEAVDSLWSLYQRLALRVEEGAEAGKGELGPVTASPGPEAELANDMVVRG